MHKIRRISDFLHTFSFSSQTEQFDIFYDRFLRNDLGKIYRAVPWDDLVVSFGLKESKKGPARLFSPKGKLALMLPEHYSGGSDRTLMEHLNGNLEWQFFCGIHLGEDRPANFRAISEIRCELAKKLDMDRVQQAFYAHWSPNMADRHSLVMDATCYESYLRYPTNIKLLWESVEWLHNLIGHLCKEPGTPLPRNKYLKWKKRYVSYSKMKRKTKKKKRATAKKVYGQQHAYFYRGEKPKARIVSLDKDYIRPIVRGKETKAVEFGAKVNKFQIDGIGFIEHLGFEAFHEGNRFQDTVFKAQRPTKVKTRLAGADAIYATNRNRSFAARYNIRTDFKRGKHEKQRRQPASAITNAPLSTKTLKTGTLKH